MKTQALPEDYAIVLQQINEDGGDVFEDLAETLRLDRSRLGHIIQSLHHKGLIIMQHGIIASDDAWMSLSTKGRRLMQYMWPESQYLAG